MFFSNLTYKNVDNIVKNYKLTFGRKEKITINLSHINFKIKQT